MTQQNEFFIENDKIDDNLEPWQRLDNVIRTWASQSGFEKDQELYYKMQKQHE